ncbi:MAG TPA: TatD family hydrolase [Candidatus Paceibacterota bacterium]
MERERIEFIDVHSHVNFAAYADDYDAVLCRAHDAGVAVINVGTQIDTSLRAVDLANKYADVYAIIGLHPVHCDKSYHDKKELGEEGKGFVSRGEVFDQSTYKKMALDSKVVAIGECGLDYYRAETDSKYKQKENFIAQIALANEIEKPLMLHIRDAYDDAFEIIKSEAKVRGNVHFFAGNKEQAKRFLELGFTLSFTGVITFTRDCDEIVKYVPLSQILSETDSPYVTPVPFRGKRNEPAYVVEVVNKISEIKSLNLEDTKKQLLKNAAALFNIPFGVD